MTPIHVAVSILFLAWVVWMIRLWRILREQDNAQERAEWEREEDAQRRALGHLTTLQMYRRIEHQPLTFTPRPGGRSDQSRG